jgi:Zn finger protein HypA/HybF involved in hydrogenase expression
MVTAICNQCGRVWGKDSKQYEVSSKQKTKCPECGSENVNVSVAERKESHTESQRTQRKKE